MSRIALVTGGVSGIGAATARQLKSADYTVVASVTQLPACSSVQFIASAVYSVVQIAPVGKSRAQCAQEPHAQSRCSRQSL